MTLFKGLKKVEQGQCNHIAIRDLILPGINSAELHSAVTDSRYGDTTFEDLGKKLFEDSGSSLKGGYADLDALCKDLTGSRDN